MRESAAGRGRGFVLAVALAAVLCGTVLSSRIAWTCDDAFISFRYADNLVRGDGLVFNAGERVEGYTNFLWTLGCAAGMALGYRPERWSEAWGIVFYAASILLLGWRFLRAASTGPSPFPCLPLAAVLAAAHADWNVWATGGLETSLFTFLGVLGYVLLTSACLAPSRSLFAGFALTLAALTRPEGVLLVGIGGLFALWTGRPRARAAAAFALPFAVLWGGFLAWRLAYYGDLFPNTYYAKSADLTWYVQGWAYARLYLAKYWVLLAGLPLVAWGTVSAMRGRAGRGPILGDRWFREVALALALAGIFSWFVVRVGGDFMYARMLVPPTPFLLILLELGLGIVPKRSVAAGTAVSLAVLLAMLFTPHPLSRRADEVAGIVNERAQYPVERREATERRGLELSRFLDGLPVRMAFLGSEARLVFYARPWVAIECETGLTDRFIARQELRERGRVGHEKRAPVDYLVAVRKAHVIFHARAPELLGLEGRLPAEEIQMGGVGGWLLHWDPALMNELRKRGARFVDFSDRIDGAITELSRITDGEVATNYAMFKLFYFDGVSDPARERPFLERLGRTQARRPRGL